VFSSVAPDAWVEQEVDLAAQQIGQCRCGAAVGHVDRARSGAVERPSVRTGGERVPASSE